MKILFISSWFPNKLEPTNGNFVQRHAEAVALKHDVEILHTIGDFNQKETFVFDLLLAYGTPKSTIKRLIGSEHDKLASNRELIVRKKLYFKVANENLHSIIDELKTQKEIWSKPINTIKIIIGEVPS